MLNSPAFESQKGLPRTGLPRSSFIIPECSEPRSDPVGVIINCSHTALLQLGTQTFGINSTEELISLNYTILEGEEEGKQFPEMWGGFLLTLPPLGRRSFTPTVELPHNGLCFQSSLPKGGSDPCSTQPSGVLGALSLLTGVCATSLESLVSPVPPSAESTTGTGNVGWKGPAGTRGRIFSLQNLPGKPWGFLPLLPSLFPPTFGPWMPGWMAHPGDRARQATKNILWPFHGLQRHWGDQVPLSCPTATHPMALEKPSWMFWEGAAGERHFIIKNNFKFNQ